MSSNYSFYINALKKFLFLLSVILVILTFWNKSVQVLTEMHSNTEFNIYDSKEVLINPKFLGVDRKKRPYVVLASKATKIDVKENIYALENPSGEIVDNDGETVFLKSLKGEFDQTHQIIFLSENVELKKLNGLLFETNSATINLKTNEISGDEKISGKNNEGNILSQGFNIVDEGNKILFNGRTNLRLK